MILENMYEKIIRYEAVSESLHVVIFGIIKAKIWPQASTLENSGCGTSKNID